MSSEVSRQKEWKKIKSEKEQLGKDKLKGVEKSCPHHFSDPEKDRMIEKLRLITGWDCDYCGKRVIEQGNDYLNNYFSKKEENFSLIEKHLVECQEAQKVINKIDTERGSKLVYDDEWLLRKKGYSKESIKKLRSWGLVGKIVLPDLKDESRIGVVVELLVMMELEKSSSHLKVKSGKTADGLVFLTPRYSPLYYHDFPHLLKNNFSFFYSSCRSKESRACERIIASFFVQKVLKKQGSWNYNIYFLENDEEGIFSEFTSHAGDSASTMIYLSLLSAYYQKPISKGVAATAAINVGKLSKFRCVQCFQENELAMDMEENFSHNKIVPVGGLGFKVSVAVKAGVKKIVLATEQREDYERNVPQEIRGKLKVYYVKDVEELEELFWKGEFS